MTAKFYSWNSHHLISWLELNFQTRSAYKISRALGIPIHRIQAWRTHPMPPISLDDLRAIARYRGWDLEQTRQWLSIQSSHFEHLVGRS